MCVCIVNVHNMSYYQLIACVGGVCLLILLMYDLSWYPCFTGICLIEIIIEFNIIIIICILNMPCAVCRKDVHA